MKNINVVKISHYVKKYFVVTKILVIKTKWEVIVNYGFYMQCPFTNI